MLIKTASFLQSNTNVAKLPKADKPEYAFIGRSNVGKSSLINMLTGNNKLAKVSATPGKTITINHFIINDEWYLVDLPGYGFAKRSQKDREMWKKMLDAYILGRQNLVKRAGRWHSKKPRCCVCAAWCANTRRATKSSPC